MKTRTVFAVAFCVLILATAAFITFGIGGCTAAQMNGVTTALGGTATPGATTQQAAAALLATATGTAAPIAAATPIPWLSIVLGIIAAVAGAFAKLQSSKAATATAAIAAAAPGISQLVTQATDGKVTANDVQTISQVAPGVIALLDHPSAKSALQAAGIIASTAASLSAVGGNATAASTVTPG
jgi:hypothetical protein